MVCEDTFTQPNGKKGYFMNQFIKENLDYELKRVQKNWDCVLLYDGEEGSAKTTLACSNARYMANEMGVPFNDDKEKNNHIIYTADEFDELLKTAPPGTNIVWDEFVLSGMSAEALSKIQVTLVKKMTMMRKKRLIVHLIIPYIFMLSKYFAIARPRCLFHVYSPDNMTRGSVSYYSKPNKRMLFMKGQKFWDYRAWKPDFVGSFTDTFGFFFDKEKYDDKKDKAMESVQVVTRADKAGKRVYYAIRGLLDKGWLQKDIQKLLRFKAHTTVVDYIKRYETPENVGFKGRSDDQSLTYQKKEIKSAMVRGLKQNASI